MEIWGYRCLGRYLQKECSKNCKSKPDSTGASSQPGYGWNRPRGKNRRNSNSGYTGHSGRSSTTTHRPFYASSCYGARAIAGPRKCGVVFLGHPPVLRWVFHRPPHLRGGGFLLLVVSAEG